MAIKKNTVPSENILIKFPLIKSVIIICSESLFSHPDNDSTSAFFKNAKKNTTAQVKSIPYLERGKYTFISCL